MSQVKRRFPIIRCPDIAPPPSSITRDQYEALRSSYELFVKALFIHNAIKDSCDVAQMLDLPAPIKSM
jgi:hypothetical protein